MTHDPTIDLDRRQSRLMFHIVDLACCMPDTFSAARLMARHGVPLAVARRVLLHPDQRRAA